MGRKKIKSETDSAYQVTTWLTQEEIMKLREISLRNGFASFAQYITIALRSLLNKQ